MSLKCIIMCLFFSLRHICWNRVVLWINIMYTIVTTYLHNTEKEWQTGIFLSIFIYLSFSKHGVKSDLTIPFFYQTNVLFIYIGAKKMDFLWAITRYCTMFTAHKKFEKDGSMRRICDDKQRQSKILRYRLCFGCK